MLIKRHATSSGPIRVMHVIDKLSVAGSGIHGVTRAIEWWISHLDPDAFSFCVCSLRAPEMAGEIFKRHGVPIFFLSLGKFDPRTLSRLLALIRRENPDILHLHGYGATDFGRVVSLMTGLPNIVHEHAVLPYQPYYQTLVDWLLAPLTTKAIGVCESVSEFMIHKRKVKKKTLETVNYGIPLDELKIPEESDLQVKREELGILPGEQVVCNVGRLDSQKGQVYLMEAAVKILRVVPNAKFLLVGDGPDRVKLELIAERENIRDRVILTGYRDDVTSLLALSDIVAMPSLWEGLPLALLEAMNSRKPVVGTSAAGMRELIKDGETGLLVPFKNADALADKILELLRDPLRAKRMGQRGWKVSRKYDISRSSRRLEEIYRELLN